METTAFVSAFVLDTIMSFILITWPMLWVTTHLKRCMQDSLLDCKIRAACTFETDITALAVSNDSAWFKIVLDANKNQANNSLHSKLKPIWTHSKRDLHIFCSSDGLLIQSQSCTINVIPFIIMCVTDNMESLSRMEIEGLPSQDVVERLLWLLIGDIRETWKKGWYSRRVRQKEKMRDNLLMIKIKVLSCHLLP